MGRKGREVPNDAADAFPGISTQTSELFQSISEASYADLSVVGDLPREKPKTRYLDIFT